MENASKALLMAAGVLIGVMLITTFVYLFVNASGFSGEYYEQQLELEQQKEYIKFEQYNGRTDLTVQDVVTIINLAVKENTKKENENILVKYNGNIYKTIGVEDKFIIDNIGYETKNNIIYMNYFTAKVMYNNEILNIEITKNKSKMPVNRSV